MRMSDEARKRMIDAVRGKRIKRLFQSTDEGDGFGAYWVLELEGGMEMAFRFMSELPNGEGQGK